MSEIPEEAVEALGRFHQWNKGTLEEIASAVAPAIRKQAEQELVAEECDKRGLPHDFETLMRHIESNHAFALSMHEHADDTIRKQERERLREGLLTNEVIASLVDPDTIPGPADFGRQRRVVEAIFATLEDSDD